MNAILNGQMVAHDHLRLDINDRSFLYGDGLFETMHLNGQIRLVDYHLDRLKKGCSVLGMDFPQELTYSKLEEWAAHITTGHNSINGFRLKLIVWRMAGGLYTPTQTNSNFMLTAREISANMDIIKEHVVVSELVFNQASVYSEFKTLSSLKYVIAGKEMKEKGGDDILIMDSNGNVSEGLYSNIFWRKGEMYFTPALSTGCISGTMRREVMTRLQVDEGIFKIAHLLDADQAFFTNSLGIFPISRIQEHYFQEAGIPKPLLQL